MWTGSIHGPDDFVRTNVNGTFSLLEAARAYWTELPVEEQSVFRFLHVSTDEVFGSLGENNPPFPNSRHMLRTVRTRLPKRLQTTWFAPITILTGCLRSRPIVRIITGLINFPEKLIPLMILNAVEGKRFLSMATGKISGIGCLWQIIVRGFARY
jgi:dTDP-glucose 4,6-dehydratase